ncbi:hypothetical protein SNOG_04425 [Parastagonospora nodorum SN15]|uniref:Uncharacterized protein n=1 Tax=Phaeosphaeria nodorum (strain SN15 / ATCC MYA-4574 / FGSC 10173) TaxID=321614 RepID=Q0UUY9_PHANO|nr:hypothetical protein SNOG_04425 [Parastagonospora nodorum SN15]EAT88185.1 hypothetical protein SNOG_04425 [Parastagonospora nodorum SN15]
MTLKLERRENKSPMALGWCIEGGMHWSQWGGVVAGSDTVIMILGPFWHMGANIQNNLTICADPPSLEQCTYDQPTTNESSATL